MVGPYVQRGGMFRERGAHDKALDDFTLAIRNAPMQAGIYVERPQSYEKLGRLSEVLDGRGHREIRECHLFDLPDFD